ncbi:MAG: VOC family protein [Maricaulaceae bacterium]|nr:VOC family protein [Maricaulaceae bacterium]
MSEQHGQFCWHELVTTDIAGAQAFYAAVTGWEASPSGMEGYTLMKAGGREVAGLMALPEEVKANGGRPAWVGYIFADDVDARAAEAAKKGGAVHHPPHDIPGVGRFAVVADPQGAVFALFHSGAEGPPPPPMGTPGHVGWNELTTSDWPAAWDFYSGMFGWRKDQAMDMGEMGTYQLMNRGGDPFGAMMNATQPGQPPAWLFYFNVDSIAAAKARVERAGGQVLHGPMEVPNEQWILVGIDPQGVMFALVGPQ